MSCYSSNRANNDKRHEFQIHHNLDLNPLNMTCIKNLTS